MLSSGTLLIFRRTPRLATPWIYSYFHGAFNLKRIASFLLYNCGDNLWLNMDLSDWASCFWIRRVTVQPLNRINWSAFYMKSMNTYISVAQSGSRKSQNEYQNYDQYRLQDRYRNSDSLPTKICRTFIYINTCDISLNLLIAFQFQFIERPTILLCTLDFV